MRVTEITVSAGRTFNHPYESYANLKPMVTVRAELAEGDEWEGVVKDLQAKAERLVEDHKQHMLAALEELENLRQRERERANIESKITDLQQRLDRLREGGIATIAIESIEPEF